MRSEDPAERESEDPWEGALQASASGGRCVGQLCVGQHLPSPRRNGTQWVTNTERGAETRVPRHTHTHTRCNMVG